MGRPRNSKPQRRAFSRRDFLRHTAATMLAAGALPLLQACGGRGSGSGGSSNTAAAPSSGANSFLHGVASGDPLPNAIVLWTRITATGNTAMLVDYVIATDPALTAVVLRGQASTDASRD